MFEFFMLLMFLWLVVFFTAWALWSMNHLTDGVLAKDIKRVVEIIKAYRND